MKRFCDVSLFSPARKRVRRLTHASRRLSSTLRTAPLASRWQAKRYLAAVADSGAYGFPGQKSAGEGGHAFASRDGSETQDHTHSTSGQSTKPGGDSDSTRTQNGADTGHSGSHSGTTGTKPGVEQNAHAGAHPGYGHAPASGPGWGGVRKAMGVAVLLYLTWKWEITKTKEMRRSSYAGLQDGGSDPRPVEPTPEAVAPVRNVQHKQSPWAMRNLRHRAREPSDYRANEDATKLAWLGPDNSACAEKPTTQPTSTTDYRKSSQGHNAVRQVRLSPEEVKQGLKKVQEGVSKNEEKAKLIRVIERMDARNKDRAQKFKDMEAELEIVRTLLAERQARTDGALPKRVEGQRA